MSDHTPGKNQLTAEIYRLKNEFDQFNGKCSFLCDAFTAVAANPECIDELTSYGFDFYAIWLKRQVTDFNDRIHIIHEEATKQP
ncbi:hypothetical protein SG34_014495 [Thalassomonas viridans]|uniref:Uncharacterized protein n=1 Tax=Thalassomonas viridans TaxID=137584 RepID=A0AAE9Z9W9_9GAMM|nr:hypothetical protein [Thalassomonas viridans]WDE07988.1 hypothetical protein SG34_014495 [Thalassomonas viridans]